MATNKKHTILFDCERMKYANTGLFHYCLQLGKALLKKKEVNFCLFTKKEVLQNFDTAQQIIQPKFWHKWFLPFANKFDVWHATHQSTDYFPYNSKKPVILTVHDLNFLYDENKSEEKKKRYLTSLQKKIDKSSIVVAISNYVLEDLRVHTNLNNKRAEVIYNGCNINTSISASDKQLHSKSFLFTIGTIASKKNFHVLPALLMNNDFDLIIAGIVQDETYKQKIIKEAQNYGVENRIIFTNAITEEEKYWYLQNCKAFVFPSIAEGFGLPVVEAMHFGKPLFLSKHTSLPEVGGNVSYYFDNFEAEHMQDVLEKGLNDYSENNVATKIKERASLFNWDKAAQQYLNLYNDLF